MAKKTQTDIPDTHRRFLPTEKDEELARVVASTEIRKRQGYQRANRTKDKDLPSSHVVQSLTDMQMANQDDYRSIVELLPEIERGMTILESAILSPKDLLSPHLMYRMGDEIVHEAKSDVLNEIQNYLTANYSLNDRLPTIVREALHSKGAYVLAVLPRNTIDTMVNEGMVSVNMQQLTDLSATTNVVEPLGLLGMPLRNTSKDAKVTMLNYADIPPQEVDVSMFNVAGMELLTISDNFNTLKLPAAAAVSRRNKVAAAVRPAVRNVFKDNEHINMQGLGTAHLAQLYKRREYKAAESIVLTTPSGDAPVYGRPIELNINAAAVVPVHVGGDVSRKEGVIVLTDSDGSPVTAESSMSQYRTLQSQNRTEDENANSVMLSKVKEMMGRGRGSVSAKQTRKELQASFSNMVITDLEERLRSGIYGDEVGMSSPDTMLELAFNRTLAGRKTRMVFIPEELVTYIAFDYDEYGLGRSRLESSKIIASMRAILLYANMNAAMVNASPNLKLVIDLDEDDQDPEATVEDTIAEFYALNAMRQPPGSTLNSYDITKSLQQMGVTISVSGNTRYPSTAVNLEDVGRNKALIERDLDESLAKRIWLMMGLSPEAVDSSYDVEFARTIVSNNLFLAKLASELQSTLLLHYSSHARKLIYSDGNLMTTLVKTVADKSKGKSENEVLDTVNEMIEAFHLALPSTDIAKIESQQQALENYSNFVEMGIQSYVNEEMLDGMIDGDLTDAIRPAIRAYRDHLMRDFMKRENILPELQTLVAGEDEFDMEERFKNHAEPIVDAMKGLIEHFRKVSREYDADEEERIRKEEDKLREKEERENAENNIEDETETLPEEDDAVDPETGGDDESEVTDDEEVEDTDTETPEGGTPEEDNTEEDSNTGGGIPGLDDLETLIE